MKRRAQVLWLILILFTCSKTTELRARPAETIEINQHLKRTIYDNQLVFGIDTGRALTIWDVTNTPEFFDLSNNNDFRGGGNIWAKIHLRNISGADMTAVAEVRGYKDIRVFYRVIGDKDFIESRTGRFVPYPENALGYRKFRINKVELTFRAGATYEIYLFYPDPGLDKIDIAFRLAEKVEWHNYYAHNDAIINLLLGLFFGVTIILGLINLVYYFLLWDKTYLNYSIYLGTLIYFEASRYGFLDFQPLINYPKLILVAESGFLLFSVIYYLVFIESFVNLKTKFPALYKVNKGIIGLLSIAIGVVAVVMTLFEYPITAIYIRNYFILLSLPFIARLLYVLAKKGSVVDQVIVLGSFILVITGLISILLDIFFFKENYPDIVFQVGMVLEITIFSIGLGMKSRQSEVQRQEMQLQLIDQLRQNEQLQRSIQEKLERQVAERTKEITAQNEELIQQSEEMAAQRDLMENQKQIIEKANIELSLIRDKLEAKVAERTKQLLLANNELIKHNSQLEQYAYVTAHNLRSPVARLKGLMYIFDKTVKVEKEVKHIVEKIVNAAHEMDDVLSDMNTILELKNNTGYMGDNVLLNDVLEKTIRNLLHEIEDSQTKVTSQFEVQSVIGSAPYFDSIFYNMISNAIKYRADIRAPEIHISSKLENGQILIRFQDNGTGIDLDRFGKKLFGMYQRFHESAGGKGLGLYMVKNQVEVMGGTINVASSPSHGTTFTISFPA